MTRFLVPALELSGLIAAVYFGVRWYLEPNGNHEPAFYLSGLVAVLAEWIRRLLRTNIDPQELATYIREGQALLAPKNESPLPIQAHNDWIEKMEKYLKKQNRSDCAVRLSDFSGLTFFGDRSERSKFVNSVDGRLRRLHEFMREASGEDH
jgi:hypothetical protein